MRTFFSDLESKELNFLVALESKERNFPLL